MLVFSIAFCALEASALAEETLAQTPESANAESQLGIHLLVIFAAAALLVFVSILLDRKKTDDFPLLGNAKKYSNEQTCSQNAAQNAEQTVVDVPSKLPGTWFSEIDRKEIKRLIEHAKTEATETFFERLGPRETPSPADIEVATNALGNVLKERAESLDWIDSLCGADTPLLQREYLKAHLKELLLAPEIPDPTKIRMEVRTSVLCAASAVGAVLGFLGGGWAAQRLLNVPTESGLLFGTPIGAALGIAVVMGIANNETLRNRLLLGLGIAGGLDVALQIFKGFIPWPTGGKVSFIKRLALYALLAVVVFISRREKNCDKKHYRQQIEAILENWLHCALTIIAVLTFKIRAIEESPFIPRAEDSRTLMNVVSVTKKLRAASGENLPLVIDELVQELETRGFEITAKKSTDENVPGESSSRPLRWDESLKERYTPIGILRPGDALEIVEEPILLDGLVEKPGVVRKVKV